MADGSKDQKPWALCSPDRASWSIREGNASIYLVSHLNLLILRSLCNRKGCKTEKREMRTQTTTFPSLRGRKNPQSPNEQVTYPSQLTKCHMYLISWVSANNRKLKTTAYKLQNALDIYVLIISPLLIKKEGEKQEGRKGSRKRMERRGYDSICKNLLLNPECLINIFPLLCKGSIIILVITILT